jgi:hypothetical protein
LKKSNVNTDTQLEKSKEAFQKNQQVDQYIECVPYFGQIHGHTNFSLEATNKRSTESDDFKKRFTNYINNIKGFRKKLYNYLYHNILFSQNLFPHAAGFPENAFRNVKDEKRLDFLILTDHSSCFTKVRKIVEKSVKDYNEQERGNKNDIKNNQNNELNKIYHMLEDFDQWSETVNIADEFYEKGRFVAVAGFEMTFPYNIIGHLNTFSVSTYKTRYDFFGAHFQSLAKMIDNLEHTFSSCDQHKIDEPKSMDLIEKYLGERKSCKCAYCKRHREFQDIFKTLENSCKKIMAETNEMIEGDMRGEVGGYRYHTLEKEQGFFNEHFEMLNIANITFRNAFAKKDYIAGIDQCQKHVEHTSISNACNCDFCKHRKRIISSFERYKSEYKKMESQMKDLIEKDLELEEEEAKQCLTRYFRWLCLPKDENGKVNNDFEANKKSITQLNHPMKEAGAGTFFDLDFNHYEKSLQEKLKQRVQLIEIVWNIHDDERSHTYDVRMDIYEKALKNGWMVAPTLSPDNHKGKWGRESDLRTAVLLPRGKRLTRENLFQAMRERHVYATDALGLDLDFRVYDSKGKKSWIMGDECDCYDDKLHVDVTAKNKKGTNLINNVSIINPDTGNEVKCKLLPYITKPRDTYNSKSIFGEIANNYRCLFVRVDCEQGRVAVSAPIWFTKNEKKK